MTQERQPNTGPNGDTEFKHSPLAASINQQLEHNLAAAPGISDLPSSSKEIVSAVALDYLETRYQRAQDLKSEELRHAINISNIYLSVPFGDEVVDVEEVCMDSRVRKSIFFGLPPNGFASSWRYSGGKPSGLHILRGSRGEYALDETSNYAERLDEIFRRPDDDGDGTNIIFNKDSHKTCAKQTADEIARKGMDLDGGLLEDVISKTRAFKAITAYSKNYNIANLVLTHSSSDPRTGFVDYGLEKESALKIGREEGGYTDEVLAKLRDDGIIVSTQYLAESVLNDLFTEHQHDGRLNSNYRHFMANQWNNLKNIHVIAMNRVRPLMSMIYEGIDEVKLDVLTRKAVASAYAGWINNLGEGYAFKEHRESLLVAGVDHGPFAKAEALEITRDSRFLPNDAVLASTVVRNNRLKGLVPGKVDDPIPLIVQARLHTEIDHDKLVETISKMQRKLPMSDWHNMQYQNFIEFVIKNDPDMSHRNVHGVTADFAHEFAKLGCAMAQLYDPKNPFAEFIETGSIVPIPFLTDQTHEPIGIFPFF